MEHQVSFLDNVIAGLSPQPCSWNQIMTIIFTEKAIHYQKAVHHLDQSVSPSSPSSLSWGSSGCWFCPPPGEPRRSWLGWCRTTLWRRGRKWAGPVVCCNRRMFQHSRQTPREFSPTDPGEQILSWTNDVIIDHINAISEDWLTWSEMGEWNPRHFLLFWLEHQWARESSDF